VRRVDGLVSLGKIMVFIGVVVMVFGLLILLVSRFTGGAGAPLPGDIVIRRHNTTIYFPIVTSIVLSVILTIVLWIVSAIRR
jgi:hypothetical protein